MFLTYCVVQLRDTVMIRPHPALWYTSFHPVYSRIWCICCCRFPAGALFTGCPSYTFSSWCSCWWWYVHSPPSSLTFDETDVVLGVAQDEPSGRDFLAKFYSDDLKSQHVDNDKLYATDCRVFTPEDPHSSMARVESVRFRGLVMD